MAELISTTRCKPNTSYDLLQNYAVHIFLPKQDALPLARQQTYYTSIIATKFCFKRLYSNSRFPKTFLPPITQICLCASKFSSICNS